MRKMQFYQRFLKNPSGNAAVIFSLATIPVLLAIGLSIDLGRTLLAKRQVQDSIDAVVLAAASFKPNTAGESIDLQSERQRIAQSQLADRLTEVKFAQDISYDVSYENDVLTIDAQGQVPTTIGAMIAPSFPFSVSTAARTADKSFPLCMLALNVSEDDTFKTWGTAELDAPECAVHSNSKSNKGMTTRGNAKAASSFFCSSGGYAGDGFQPKPATNCKVVQDPYADQYTTSALDAEGIDIGNACSFRSTFRPKEDYVFDAGGPTSVMSFCGGLTLRAGVYVEFRPGIYVFNKSLNIGSNSSVNAPEGVTFYFPKGQTQNDTELTVQGGANLILRAPTEGPLAGMAIVQPEIKNYTGTSRRALKHTIIGGGEIDILGAIYTPQAKLYISGNGDINANSNYFSIIADIIEIEGNGFLSIAADSKSSENDMPDLPPSSTSGGVYLIK